MLIRHSIPTKYAVWDKINKVFIFHSDELEQLGWFARGAMAEGYEIRSHFHLVTKYIVDEQYSLIIDDMLDEIAVIEDGE